VAIPDSRERLHTEKEAIKKPMPTRAASDAVLLETVQGRENEI